MISGSIIDEARATAVRSVNFSHVQMYWNIGRRIFEEEQQGKERTLSKIWRKNWSQSTGVDLENVN